jgi:hypothetical protein
MKRGVLRGDQLRGSGSIAICAPMRSGHEACM